MSLFGSAFLPFFFPVDRSNVPNPPLPPRRPSLRNNWYVWFSSILCLLCCLLLFVVEVSSRAFPFPPFPSSFKIILFQGEERLLFPWNPFALFHRAFQSLQLIIRIICIRRGIIGAFYLVTSRSRGIYQSHEHVFRSSRSYSSSSLSRDNHRRHFCAAKKCGKET